MIDSIEPTALSAAEPKDVEAAPRTEPTERGTAARTFRIGPLRFQKSPLSGLALGLSLLGWAAIAALVYLFW
jgi:hypothetical protein